MIYYKYLSNTKTNNDNEIIFKKYMFANLWWFCKDCLYIKYDIFEIHGKKTTSNIKGKFAYYSNDQHANKTYTYTFRLSFITTVCIITTAFVAVTFTCHLAVFPICRIFTFILTVWSTKSQFTSYNIKIYHFKKMNGSAKAM